MNVKTILRLLVQFSLSALLTFSMLWISFHGGAAATPAPESNPKEQIPDQKNTPDGIFEKHHPSASKSLESESFNNPNIKTSGALYQETFYSLADSFININFPTLNYGDGNQMHVGYDAYTGLYFCSLVFFYISSLPSNQNILGATLKIYLVGASDFPNASPTISTYRITSNWAEGTVTWNNAPSIGEVYGSRSILHNALGWHEFDVTDLVRSWYDGTYQNYGIWLDYSDIDVPADYSFRSFSTREGDFAPELVVQYEPIPSPPTIAGLPDLELTVDTSLDNAIDLWAYANDSEDADAALSFTINNTPNSSAGVSIDSNRYIDINPSTGWTGVTNVEIEVTDTDGLSDMDSFQVEVIGGSSNSPPTISGLPDKQLPVNTSQNNAIDLWAYANDVEDADVALSFTINNNPNPSAGVSIDSNRYIDINPASGWTGTTNVAIEVMDTDGYSDIDFFQVRIIGEIRIINLPIVQKNSTFESTSIPSPATLPQ